MTTQQIKLELKVTQGIKDFAHEINNSSLIIWTNNKINKLNRRLKTK
jgi:hypothetical protein